MVLTSRHCWYRPMTLLNNISLHQIQLIFLSSIIIFYFKRNLQGSRLITYRCNLTLIFYLGLPLVNYAYLFHTIWHINYTCIPLLAFIHILKNWKCIYKFNNNVDYNTKLSFKLIYYILGKWIKKKNQISYSLCFLCLNNTILLHRYPSNHQPFQTLNIMAASN